MAIKKQYYGIKFPFTANNLSGFFIDLNNTLEDKVVSEMVHVILTPKKTRIRKPDFGTDLAKFLFEPDDELTWDSVRKEVAEAVSRYVPNVELNSIEIETPTEDPNSIYLDLRYTVKKGNKTETGRTVVKI